MGPRILRAAAAGTLWEGPVPRPDLGPLDVIVMTLEALRANDDRQPSAGTAFLRRFSTDEFMLAGEAVRLPPQGLTAFMAASQYCLLLEPDGVSCVFPSDMCQLDHNQAWQEVVLEDRDGEMLVKMGWELEKRPSDSCWLTCAISWHDFRDAFRPGIGQEEWDRSFG